MGTEVKVTARDRALSAYPEASYFEATGSVVFRRMDPFTVSQRSVSVPPL
jgi:hypothetical protein